VLRSATDWSPKGGSMGNCLSAGCYRIVLVKTKRSENEMSAGYSPREWGVFAGSILRTWVNQLAPESNTEGYILREVVQRGSQLAHVTIDKNKCLLGDVPPRPVSQMSGQQRLHFTFVANIQVRWHSKPRLLRYSHEPYCAMACSINSASTE